MYAEDEEDDELRRMVGKSEKILYAGKPDKKCFIYESLFNPMLPFALIWGVVDFGFIGLSWSAQDMRYFLIPFFALHLFPVWLYLGMALLTLRRYKNLGYVITDKAIYRSEGILAKRFLTKPFAELSHVDLHRGVFDQWLGVGDVVTTSAQAVTMPNGKTYTTGITIEDIPDYIEVYNLVKKLQEDVYTDVMYPNDLRPQENHGYRTKYQGDALDMARGKRGAPTTKHPEGQG